MSGVAFHPDLVDKLMQRFPGVIGGFKDSANDAQLERELHNRHPGMLMFPSKESSLTQAREYGYAGCISGTVALWPELAARVWRGDASSQPELTRLRDLFANISIINGVRYVLARNTGKSEWERCLPPLMTLPESQAGELARLNGTLLRS
jgi:dihydrodipicolinate synthase/N-acetylneuraminate lyase